MAEAGNTSISIQQLKNVADSLKNQQTTFNQIYNNRISGLLETNASYFSVPGLDTTQIKQAFETAFRDLNTKYEELINVLEYNVIHNYDQLTTDLNNLFGKTLVDQINQLLGTSMGQ